MHDEAIDGSSGRAPRVPDLEVARALLWLAIALAGLYVASAPAALPALAVNRETSGSCALSAEAGARCPCGELPGALRRVLGLPLSLARASAAELEGLPGIGPRRARDRRGACAAAVRVGGRAHARARDRSCHGAQARGAALRRPRSCLRAGPRRAHS